MSKAMETDIRDMCDSSFEDWLNKATGENLPSEVKMAEILSLAMRTDDPEMKAQHYVALANMAMNLADTTLGSQGSVVTSVTLRLH